MSILRFIPLGDEVSSVAIYLLSFILRKMASSFQNLSMTITVMSPIVCTPELKCAATGFSWVLRCVMSARWLFILQWSAWPVSPIYIRLPTTFVLDEIDTVGCFASGCCFHLVLTSGAVACSDVEECSDA